MATPPTPPQQTLPQQEDPALKKRNKGLLQEIASCKTYRRKLIKDWSLNTDYRRGKPFQSQSDSDRIAVNLDWSTTSQKQALLFSRLPQVHISHPPQSIAQDVPWLHPFEQRINDNMVTAGAEAAMDELLPDCINAAGIGAVIVAREAITEDVEVPAIDMAMLPPEVHQQILQSGLMPDGTPVPMEVVPRVVDSRYTISRLSPADLLWQLNFTGSDFDNAPWIGRSGRLHWPLAMTRFKLDPAKKQSYLGEERMLMDRLSSDIDKDKDSQEELVSFDEVFYKEHLYDTASKSFSTIHHVVFINDKAVLDEPWKGQQLDQESSELVGALKSPIRALTLDYISDEAIPPSASAIGRPQVDELNKSRSQMIQQREHSKPITFHDVNRLDPTISQALMRGVWQHSIPVQGNGQNVIGSVPRAPMPQENFLFDRIIKSDYNEAMSVGQGQTGSDVETKAEVQAIGAGMQTRISRERAKVAKFYSGIAEVLGGLMSIYEEPTSFGEGFSPLISKTLSYSILADSTVLLDSNQRLKQAMDFVNFTAKSGYLNLEPVMKEIATLSGFDPNVVIQAPQPKPPEAPNVSLRLTGTEDLLNPLALAMLLQSGQGPNEQSIEKAKQLIAEAGLAPLAAMILGQAAMRQIPPPPPTPMPGEPPPIQQPPLPGLEPQGPPLPGVPPPPPPGVGEANPNWSALNRVNQRVLDRGEQQ